MDQPSPQPTSLRTPEALRTARQEHIQQVRQRLMDTYLPKWDRMVAQWSANDTSHTVWLMAAACYLGHTQGQRWAIDPTRLGNRLPGAPEPDLSPLSKLDFVILTHAHADHIDGPLWKSLRDADIRWIVPKAMRKLFYEVTRLDGPNILTAEHGKTLDLDGVRLTPFEGLHWQWAPDAPAGAKPSAGIDATGYLMEFADQRWLFPGDTRTYDAERLPDFGPVDRVFAHVWLGRGEALEAHPSQLENFCQFVADLQPTAGVSLAHLYEMTRPSGDLWTVEHARRIAELLKPRLPGVSIDIPEFWERFGS